MFWTRKAGVCSGKIQQHEWILEHCQALVWRQPTYILIITWKGSRWVGEETWRKSPVLIPRHLCWAQNNFNRLHVCRCLVRQTKLLPLHLHAAVRERKGDVCFLHEPKPILIHCNCSLFPLLEKQQRRFFSADTSVIVYWQDENNHTFPMTFSCDLITCVAATIWCLQTGTWFNMGFTWAFYIAVQKKYWCKV